MHFMEYRVPSALEQIRRILAIPLKRTESRLVQHLWVSNCTFSRQFPDSTTLRGARSLSYADSHMKDFLLTLLHLAVMTAKLCGPGGVRAVIAENLVLKHQLIVLRRGRRRAPSLTLSDRLLCGFGTLFLSPGRIRKVAIALRPSTLLAFHQALVRRKYRRLFSSTPCPKKPGPKGPDEALIQAIVELKSRNPRFGCPRIARIISLTFGVDVDQNVVHRVLARHYRPTSGGSGPSWYRSSDTPPTASGAWTFFAASPSCSEPTGCWW
jgi:hypothetical protein